MPSQTIVTLTDDDGDEFPIALPGIWKENKAADVEAALRIADESIRNGTYRPSGTLKFESIDYREA